MTPRDQPMGSADTSPDADAVRAFLPRWLSLRLRHPTASASAAVLLLELPTWLRTSSADTVAAFSARFLGEWQSRLSTLADLAGRLDSHAPPAPAGSPRARWRALAGRLELLHARPAPGDRLVLSLELAQRDEGTLASALVSQALEAAAAPNLAPRGTRDGLAALRAADEQQFRLAGLPPAPGASWSPDDYLFPDVAGPLVKRLRACVDNFVMPGDSFRSKTGLAPHLDQIEQQLRAATDGWPLSRSRLLGSLRAIGDMGHHTAVAEPVRILDRPELSTVEAAGPEISCRETTGTPPGAGRRLAELAGLLINTGVPEARDFAARLHDAGVRDGVMDSIPPDTARQLVGALVYLDERARTAGEASAWARAAFPGLAEFCRDHACCRLLDRQLIDQPIGVVADLAIPVGFERERSGIESHRITRIERPGYAVVLDDGTVQVLQRAKVWIAP